MKRLSSILSIGILAVVVSGCINPSKKIVLVPETEALFRVGPKLKGKVYHWNGKEWELSAKPIDIPEGWFLGPPPKELPASTQPIE